jgi:hypothetical protein
VGRLTTWNRRAQLFTLERPGIDLASSKIVHAAIHHWPLDGVLKFSAELGRRLQGTVDAGHPYGAA